MEFTSKCQSKHDSGINSTAKMSQGIYQIWLKGILLLAQFLTPIEGCYTIPVGTKYSGPIFPQGVFGTPTEYDSQNASHFAEYRKVAKKEYGVS